MLQFILALQNRIADVVRKEDRGATAVEYGLIVALIAIVIVAGLQLIGTNLLGAFNTIAGKI